MEVISRSDEFLGKLFLKDEIYRFRRIVCFTEFMDDRRTEREGDIGEYFVGIIRQFGGQEILLDDFHVFQIRHIQSQLLGRDRFSFIRKHACSPTREYDRDRSTPGTDIDDGIVLTNITMPNELADKVRISEKMLGIISD